MFGAKYSTKCSETTKERSPNDLLLAHEYCFYIVPLTWYVIIDWSYIKQHAQPLKYTTISIQPSLPDIHSDNVHLQIHQWHASSILTSWLLIFEQNVFISLQAYFTECNKVNAGDTIYKTTVLMHLEI